MTKTAVKDHIDIVSVPPEAPAPQLPAVRQEARVAPASAPPPHHEPKHFSGKIAKAILAISAEIGKIQKEGFNEFQRYKYTRWEDINEKLSPLLTEHGLIIVQSEQSRSLLEENDKGSVLAIVYHFTLINEHGDQWPAVEWTAIARLRDQKGVTDDKAASKCHTQAEKGFCIKQFKIRTDDFVDGDAHSTLPKKDARDVYSKLQGEIDRADTTKALKAWASDNAERIRVLPLDWQNVLRDRYKEKLSDLENQLAQTLAAPTEIVDEQTGEIQSSAATQSNPETPAAGKAGSNPIEPAASFEEVAHLARQAAMGGLAAYAAFWGQRSKSEQAFLDTMTGDIDAILKRRRQ